MFGKKKFKDSEVLYDVECPICHSIFQASPEFIDWWEENNLGPGTMCPDCQIEVFGFIPFNTKATGGFKKEFGKATMGKWKGS